MNEERLRLLNAIAKVMRRFPHATMEVSDYDSEFKISIRIETVKIE